MKISVLVVAMVTVCLSCTAGVQPLRADEPPVTTQPAAVPLATETLSRFFDSEQVAAAVEYHGAAASTPDAASVEALYEQAVALERKLLGPVHASDDIWPALDDFLNADLGLYGITPACAAECSIPALGFDVALFQEKARATPGGVDDAFFEILALAYGENVRFVEGRNVSWPTFFEQTWDYGGHSLLGSGAHLSLLSKIERSALDRMFLDQLNELRVEVLEDLRSDCLGLPAAEASDELDKILKSVQLAPDERAALTERQMRLADPAAYGIEAECKEKRCSCNSG